MSKFFFALAAIAVCFVAVQASSSSSRKTNRRGKEKRVDRNPVSEFQKMFEEKVLTGLTPVDVWLSHKEKFAGDLDEWTASQQQIHHGKLLELETSRNQRLPDEYMQLPEHVNITIVKDDSELSEMIIYLKATAVERIGMDTENDALDISFQLVQIATENRCFLIRERYLKKMKQKGLAELGKVLSNKTIVLFAGLGDLSQLKELFPGYVPGKKPVDLQIQVRGKFIRYTEKGKKKSDLSLLDCVETFMGKKLNKDQQLSNWKMEELSEEQRRYAALDAWVLLPLHGHITNPNDPAYIKEARLQLGSMSLSG